MAAGEGGAVHDVCSRVLFEDDPNVSAGVQRRRSIARIDHLHASDPAGAWVAERGGEVAGVAMAIVRGALWGFSLFAVDEDLQGRGVGRALLDAALGYGEQRGADGWLILSSERPAAMHRYGAAGFDLRPSLSAVGVPDLRRAPDGLEAVADAGAAGLPLASAIGAEVRGAGYADDLGFLLDTGARLIVFENRAFALAREAHVLLLGARDEAAAELVLWAALTTAPPGATAIICFMTAQQQWAIRVAQQARLPLSPDGPVCVRGAVGPLAPYLPNGAFL